MNKYLKIFTTASIFPMLCISAKVDNENNMKNEKVFSYDELLNSALISAMKLKKEKTINFLINKWKIIKNFDVGESLLVWFSDNAYMVINLDTYEIVEYNAFANLTEKQFKKVNTYVPFKSLSFVDENNETFSIIDSKNLDKKFNSKNVNLKNSGYNPNEFLNVRNRNINRIIAQNKEYKRVLSAKQLFSIENNPKFLVADYEIDYSWWFKTNFDLFGYTSLLENNDNLSSRSKPSDKGLCEYVALSMFTQYYQLFKNSDFLTDSQFDSYATLMDGDYYKKDLPSEYDLNLHWQENYAFLDKNNLPFYPIFSAKLAYQMYKNTDVINIVNPKHYRTAFQSIVKNDNIHCNWYSTIGLNKPWEVIYSNRPVIIGGWVVSETKNVSSEWHAVVAYGKWYEDNKDDEISNLYLVHYGWSSNEQNYSQVAVSAYYIRYWGYEFYIDDNTKKEDIKLKKYFYKNGKYLSAKDLPKKIDL